MALMVRTRLWLGGALSPQHNERLIVRLIQMVRQSALARPLLFCVDGYRASPWHATRCERRAMGFQNTAAGWQAVPAWSPGPISLLGK
jgi:hypothetical protein